MYVFNLLDLNSSFVLDRNIPTFYACLKDERDLWFTFLSEISAAQKNSFALRDKKLVDQGKSNIMLALALLELQYPLKTVEGNVSLEFNSDFPSKSSTNNLDVSVIWEISPYLLS